VVCALGIAVLPGYSQAGMISVAVMIALRLIDGIFMGGEYTGATPLAMEASPNGRRGWYGGLVGAGFAFAYCAIALVTLLVLQFAPEGGPTAAYSVWGWRIPFIVGAVLCGVFLVWYSRQVDESSAWQAAEKVRNPVREVLVGRSARDYLQVFIMMTGVWFASNMASGLLPTSLQSEAHVSATEVTGALVIVQAIHTILFPFIGEWSERVGRRVFLAWNGVAVGVVCALAFASLAAGWWSGFGLVLLVTLIIRLSGGSMFAITPSYLSERFPAAIRGSGFGLGYGGPLLITSFYAYYQNWLGHLMPSSYTPVVLLVLGGIFMVTGALMGPETRSVDFSVTTDESPVPGSSASGTLATEAS
jgi:MFS family permease